MAPKAKMESEEWFEEYLRDSEHLGWDDHEPDLGVRTRPEYRISKNGSVAICEVEEFGDSALHRRLAGAGGQALTVDDKEQHRAVRKKISKAAEQLKPLSGQGIPLVAVLANPRRIKVPSSDVDIGAAMYGLPGVATLIDDETGHGGEFFATLGANGQLSTTHDYLSAVAFLDRRHRQLDLNDAWVAETQEERNRACGDDLEKKVSMLLDGLAQLERVPGEYVSVRVFHTIASQDGRAVPLPSTLFDDGRATHLFPDALSRYGTSVV